MTGYFSGLIEGYYSNKARGVRPTILQRAATRVATLALGWVALSDFGVGGEGRPAYSARNKSSEPETREMQTHERDDPSKPTQRREQTIENLINYLGKPSDIDFRALYGGTNDYPELTTEERVAVLDALLEKAYEKLDSFSNNAIGSSPRRKFYPGSNSD